MSVINFLKKLLLVFVALLIYAQLLMKYGAGVFSMIFDVAGGDGNVIFFLFSGLVLTAFVGLWVWSAKSKQRRSVAP